MPHPRGTRSTHRILLNLNPQRRVPQPHAVPHSRPVHRYILVPPDVRGQGQFRYSLNLMLEIFLLQLRDDVLHAVRIDDTRRESVSARDYLCAGYSTQRDHFGLARLEAHGGPGSDVESLPVCESAVE